ncbi:MAG: acetyl-CoA C-acyltransferase [Planctomycetes bacterium]|nr:acetyl-CoA C-acyltransferase [Planctomycetota bacterium]
MEEIVVVGGARTAMAEYVGTPGHGAFADVSAIELGGVAARAALARSGVDPKSIDHVVMGNALQTSGDAIYGARHVALKAGIPAEKPALTVNRLCGSGLEALAQAARFILLGEAQYVLAGGMENMSQAPHVLRGLRKGLRLGEGALEDSLMVSLLDSWSGLYMAQTAERLAKRYGIGREAQDEYALRSHALGAKAVQEGRFAEEIEPVQVKKGRETIPWTLDDHIKPDTSMEKLARLAPAFDKNGTVTAGNASGIVDGAAALVVTTAARARQDGRRVLGRIVSWHAVGVDPDVMGIGPAPAIRGALEKAGLSLDAVDLFEINEAFAGPYLAVEKELGLPREKVNVNGGAIALGHPLGASGARLALTLLAQLARSGKRHGVASACIGGGQGIALVLEGPAGV